MSRRIPLPLEKLARAAKLHAEATRLYAEAAQELAHAAQTGSELALLPPPPVTEIDQARVRRILRRMGVRE